MSPPTLFLFFFKIALAIWGPLRFYMNVRVDFSISAKKVIGIFFFFFRAAPVEYGSSQARSQSRAAAAGLRHSHSNRGS